MDAQPEIPFEDYHRGFKPTRGSVEYNAVECLSSNIPSLVSLYISHPVSARRTISTNSCAGSLLLTSETGAEDRSLTLGLALVHKSLAFSGITDMQRVAGPGVPREVVERTRTLHPEMCAKPGQVPAARQD
ncbi:fungal zn binuclear cluster domain containing protein [Diaporthe eres]|nr:fungal zn binuclear cluster domain containing protein [Diaporthe eres]